MPGKYPYTPSVSPGYTLSQQKYPYRKYIIQSGYFFDSGQEDMPVAYQTGTSTQKSVELVVTNQPIGRKRVIFEIERLGIQPELPNPAPQSTNETLLRAVTYPEDPQLDATGQYYVYRVTGEYLYSLAQPVFVTNFDWPQNPADGGQRQSFNPQNVGNRS